MFGTGTQHVSCTDDAYALCALDEGYPYCDHISAFLNGYDLVGMSQFSLTFKDVASTSQNPKSLATHSNRGPDAGLVTDGVFAADGTSWDDPTYTVILPLVGPTYGLTVDLGVVGRDCSIRRRRVGGITRPTCDLVTGGSTCAAGAAT